MKLAGYYTSSKTAGFKSKNPKAVYVNLSLANDGDWLKTHVIINGQIVDIPRWVMLDYLRIGEILMPERRTVRFHKDRLTVSPELEGMLAERGFRYSVRPGEHVRVGAPELDTSAVGALTFADRVREGVEAKELTVADMLEKIVESYRMARQGDGGDAFSVCQVVYGWSTFELTLALASESESIRG